MTTSESSDSTAPGNPTSDSPRADAIGTSTEIAELFAVHALLKRLGDQITDQCQMSSGIVGRQRSDLESLTEWLRRLESSLRDAHNHVDTLGTALDRIKIVALNTGLEGARLGDVAGKALISVSDELRSLTARGLELLSEQASNVEQMEADRQRIVALVERGQLQLGELEQRLREALTTEQASHQATARLATALHGVTGLDVEAAAQLGRISDQAKQLTESLSNLCRSDQQSAARAALLPALQPLLTWLSSKP